MLLKVGLDKGSNLQLESQHYWTVACQVRWPITIYTKLRGLSPRANYIDRRLSAKLVPTSDRGCRVVSATDTHGRILGFLDRSRYYFFQVAPQLYSRG
jgi:hypothetical protein